MIVLDLPPWIVYPFLFLFGSIVGSFLNVCIYRIPLREEFWPSLKELWDRPSQCRRCGVGIRWHDNIPIFGWLALRGRCRNCRARISPRYPLIELLTASLFVVVFWCEAGYGIVTPLESTTTWSPMGPQAVPGLRGMSITTFVLLRYSYHMVLICGLIVATFIDFDLQIIPDGATLPVLAVGLFGGVATGCVHLVPVWFENRTLFGDSRGMLPEIPGWIMAHPHWHGLAASVAGVLVGGGMVWGVRILGHWALRQEAMGLGDVILMAMMGSFLGWQPMVLVFFLAPACGLVVVIFRWIFIRADRVIPYGPYLSLAALLTLLLWPWLWYPAERYLGAGPVIVPLGAAAMFALLTVSLVTARLIKRMLGIADLAEEEPVWTAADQTFHFSGEQVDNGQGQWRRGGWPGGQSGRGQLHVDRWRGR
ncbi:MAG: prepilin peptidase [Planctomyces sp.]|nr:prepilin peptidase [Planctomyces sp.]